MLVTIFHHSCGNLRPMNICWGCGGIFSSVPRHRHNGHQTDVIMKMMSQNKESRYMAPILMSWTSHVRAAAPSYAGAELEIGLIICSRQPRFISIRDTAPFIWTWFSSTAASDADIHQRPKLLPSVRQAKHFFSGESLLTCSKICHAVKKLATN